MKTSSSTVTYHESKAKQGKAELPNAMCNFSATRVALSPVHMPQCYVHSTPTCRSTAELLASYSTLKHQQGEPGHHARHTEHSHVAGHALYTVTCETLVPKTLLCLGSHLMYESRHQTAAAHVTLAQRQYHTAQPLFVSSCMAGFIKLIVVANEGQANTKHTQPCQTSCTCPGIEKAKLTCGPNLCRYNFMHQQSSSQGLPPVGASCCRASSHSSRLRPLPTASTCRVSACTTPSAAVKRRHRHSSCGLPAADTRLASLPAVTAAAVAAAAPSSRPRCCCW